MRSCMQHKGPMKLSQENESEKLRNKIILKSWIFFEMVWRKKKENFLIFSTEEDLSNFNFIWRRWSWGLWPSCWGVMSHSTYSASLSSPSSLTCSLPFTFPRPCRWSRAPWRESFGFAIPFRPLRFGLPPREEWLLIFSSERFSGDARIPQWLDGAGGCVEVGDAGGLLPHQRVQQLWHTPPLRCKNTLSPWTSLEQWRLFSSVCGLCEHDLQLFIESVGGFAARGQVVLLWSRLPMGQHLRRRQLSLSLSLLFSCSPLSQTALNWSDLISRSLMQWQKSSKLCPLSWEPRAVSHRR